MLNFNHVFTKKTESCCYVQKITPDESIIKKIENARDKIKQTLREKIPVISANVLDGNRVTPKFITQGSWAYKTCNAPFHAEQEMDLDIGVYLPVHSWEDSDLHPKVAAKIYFAMIESSLEVLVRNEDWRFDKEKDTCVRIKLNNIPAHIDVPLYVAPDEDFKTIITEARALDSKFEAPTYEDFSLHQWEQLTKINLAMRDGTWKESDPRKAFHYFNTYFKEDNSQQLRRICRYLKSMRDFHWEVGGPTSILLMICAINKWSHEPQRDDVALLGVLKELGEMLNNPVHCESINTDEDFNRMTPEERSEARKWANKLYCLLAEALQENGSSNIPHHLQELKGKMDQRIPDDISLVQIDDNPIEDIVKSTPAIHVPQPTLGEVSAG